MSKFKAGDRVWVMEVKDGVDLRGKIGVVREPVGITVEFKGWGGGWWENPGEASDCWGFNEKDLELVEENPLRTSITLKTLEDCSFSYGLSIGQEESKSIKGGIMSNIVSKVKELALSADEKLLRKHGVVDSCGELTPEGVEILESVLFEKYRTEVVAAVKKVDEAEKKAKK